MGSREFFLGGGISPLNNSEINTGYVCENMYTLQLKIFIDSIAKKVEQMDNNEAVVKGTLHKQRQL